MSFDASLQSFYVRLISDYEDIIQPKKARGEFMVTSSKHKEDEPE